MGGRQLVRAGVAALVVALLAGCASGIRSVQRLTGGYMVGTAGTSESAILVAAVDSGLLLIDLGWVGAAEELTRLLEAMGRTRDDIAAVLLTHAHRDHIAAWPLVTGAPVHIAGPDLEQLLGRVPARGAVAGLADRVLPAPRPDPADLDIRTFAGDTTLVFGRDTVRAFAVPGHTAGSTAYLFRGVLFVGDALSSSALGRLTPPVGVYSADRDQGIESIDRLWPRLAPYDVHFVCTAHARCVPYREVRRQWRQR